MSNMNTSCYSKSGSPFHCLWDVFTAISSSIVTFILNGSLICSVWLDHKEASWTHPHSTPTGMLTQRHEIVSTFRHWFHQWPHGRTLIRHDPQLLQRFPTSPETLQCFCLNLLIQTPDLDLFLSAKSCKIQAVGCMTEFKYFNTDWHSYLKMVM